MASAIGASLLMMVAALPKTRTNSDDERRQLSQSAGALAGWREALTDAVDADTAAYDEVVAAYRMAKSTDADKADRRTAVQRALQHATDVPLKVMELSSSVLDAARIVAAHGHRGAASDVGVAIALVEAGMTGARLNVDINLGGIEDAEYKARVASDVERFSLRGAAALADARRSLAPA